MNDEFQNDRLIKIAATAGTLSWVVLVAYVLYVVLRVIEFVLYVTSGRGNPANLTWDILSVTLTQITQLLSGGFLFIVLQAIEQMIYLLIDLRIDLRGDEAGHEAAA